MAKIPQMKKFLILVVTVVLFSNGSCQNEKEEESTTEESGPVSTTGDQVPNTSKEGILKNLQSEFKDLDENDVCIVEVGELGNLFVVGFFAHDRGCSVNHMFFEGEQLPGDHTGAKMIMDANNFDKNNLELVQHYHIEVINTFKSILTEVNEDFEQSKELFFTPEVSFVDGKVVSKLWVQRPSGMVKENSYYVSTLTFDNDGNFISLEKSNQFSVAY